MIRQSKADRARIQMRLNAMRVEAAREVIVDNHFNEHASREARIRVGAPMLSKEIDRLACEPYPRERVEVPRDGQRCPRCHRRIRAGFRHPCALCNPMEVPGELYDVLVLRPQG